MLLKKNRADRKTIEKIFKEGNFLSSDNLTLRFVVNNNTNDSPKVSFIAPKSIAKLAVRRNLLRRRGYDALEKHIKQLPRGLVGVFIFKKYQANTPIIEDEIKKILSKLN